MSTVGNVRGRIMVQPTVDQLGYLEGKPWAVRLRQLHLPAIQQKEVIEYACKAAHVPESTMRMASEAIFDAIQYFVGNGHTVQFPELGAFALQVNAKTAKTPEEVDAAEDVRRKYIRLYPKADVREMCNLGNVGLVLFDPHHLVTTEG